VAVEETELTAISIIDSIDTNLVSRTISKITDFSSSYTASH